MTDDLRALLHGALTMNEAMQKTLDKLLPRTVTVYAPGEAWSIAWARRGEFEIEFELALDPPDGAHEWQRATSEHLEELKTKLGADRVYAQGLEAGLVRYIVGFNKRTP